MKKFMYALCAMLTSSVLYAQETKLVVDSQTPGWLSSLLTYPQQKAVEELTLSGYINKTDMSFVNGLIRDQKLKVLDLSDVHLVGDSKGDDYIWDYFLSYGKEKMLQKVRLPQNIKGKSGSFWIISSLVDTLELGYKDLGLGCTEDGNTLSKFCVCPPQHLILQEGVKIIPDGAFSFKSTYDYTYDYTDGTNCLVTLPSTITRIGGRAFDNRCVFNEPLLLPDSIEFLGRHVFSDDGYQVYQGPGIYGAYNTWWRNWKGDDLKGRGNKKPVSTNRFDFPKNLISYNSHSYQPYMNASGEKESFPCDTYESDTIVIYEKCENLSANLIAKIAVFLNKEPVYFSDWDWYYFSLDTLYVPQGCLSKYENAYKNMGLYENYIKVIREGIPNSIKINVGERSIQDEDVYEDEIGQNTKLLTYTRTFNNTEWQALYVPFEMTYTDWQADFEVARLNDVHQWDDDDDGVIDRTELEAVKLKSGNTEANTPYLIRAKSVGEKTITLTNTTLYKAEENSFDVSSWNTKFTFTGTYSGVSGTDMFTNGYYAMGGGTLHQAESSAYDLSPMRWYMKVTDRDGNPKSLGEVKVMVFGEDTDGIGLTENAEKTEDAEVYDLSGRRTGKPTKKGLYIRNGRKVIVR